MASKVESDGGTDPKPAAEPVSLGTFIATNWQMLTMFGVFIGFTNYLSNTENKGLVTVGFLLTLLLELEILQLLLKIKNKAFLLKIFTLLTALFIIISAGFIYSSLVSTIFSGFGIAVIPFITENRTLILRSIFFASLIIIVIGLYNHLRALVNTASYLIPKKQTKLVARIAAVLACVAVMASLIWMISPDETQPMQTTTTIPQVEECAPPLKLIGEECCLDGNANGVCDGIETSTTSTTSSTSTTTTTVPYIECMTNAECGNQTITRICYKTDVYLQQKTPLCQKPGTPEARCIDKIILVGETLTQGAVPEEVCPRGCKEGACE